MPRRRTSSARTRTAMPTTIRPRSLTFMARSTRTVRGSTTRHTALSGRPRPRPSARDFTPYVTAGHWVYDDDWVWVSDYPWGWAPFHYGRWVLVEGRGWAWIPGRVYRGAWVVWSVDDGYGYLGWAPAPPAFVWFGGVAVGWNVYVGPRWVVLPARRSVRAGGRSPHHRRSCRSAHRCPARLYVPATPGVVGGPPPQRLGFNAAQIPQSHRSGRSARGTCARVRAPVHGSSAGRATTDPGRAGHDPPRSLQVRAFRTGRLARRRRARRRRRRRFATAPPSVGVGRAPTVMPSAPAWGGAHPSVARPAPAPVPAPAPAPRAPSPNFHFGGGGAVPGGGGGGAVHGGGGGHRR